MIISDLAYLEVVSEETSIIGGLNAADALAGATALGANTVTFAVTKTAVIQGVGSSSSSQSGAATA